MSIYVEWGTSDHTLLIWRVTTEVTLDDYRNATKQTSHMLKSAGVPSTIVVDVRQCQHTSHNLIPTMRDQIRYLQSFPGELIVLSKTQFWQSLYLIAAQSSIGMKLPNIRFQFTQDETSDILATL